MREIDKFEFILKQVDIPTKKRMNIILADSSNSQPKEVTFPRSNFF